MKLVSTFLLCLFCLVASAQNDTTKYFRSLDYGWSYKRLQAREALIMPVDTFVNKLGMALLNNKLYSGNGIKWTLINGGTTIDTTKYIKYTDSAAMLNPYLKKVDTASLSNRINLKLNATDTASLSNRINLKIDSLKKSNDSIYYFANGVRKFAYKDSAGGSNIDTTSLSNRINLKIDSLKRFNDTVYSYKNGSRLFAFKDSVGTNPAPVGYYGSFYDTTIQTAAAINTPYAMKLSNTDLSNGISISNNSRINIAHTGVYNIQFSAQFDRTNSGTDVIDIWLRKNGNNVAGSGGKIVLSGSAVASQLIASWNYVLSAIDNDYFEMMWSTPDTHVRLLSEVTQTSPFAHPNIPCVILTVTQQSGIMAGTGIQAADTVSLSNRINLKLNAIDTASLSNRINLKLNATDTASLSNRINLKLNATDTASLSNRINLKLNATDTASLSNRINLKLNATDTASLSNRINLKLNATDTASLSNRINLKLNATDTSSLSNRINLKLNATDTASLSNRINLKLNATDTASLSNRINLKLNATDTASLNNRINLKLNATDTASLSNRINLKLNVTDTASLSNRINLKLNATDTASLSNRINLKLNVTDTTAMLASYTRQKDTIPMFVFGAGSGAAGDTSAFSNSALYGSFYNTGSDTILVTSLQIGLQGTSPSINATVYFNDSLAVTAGATKLVNAGNTATNIYTGTTVSSFDNTKIPPGNWVWVQTGTVTTKPTFFVLTLIGYKIRR
jgi:tRNA threonylcarbamoyladenosine modification (KEOPS) complex  Pcc1 subunit